MNNKPVLFYYVHHQGQGHSTLFNLLVGDLQKTYAVHAVIANDLIESHVQKADAVHILPSKWDVTDKGFNHTFSQAFEGIPFNVQPARRLLALTNLVISYQPVAFFVDGSAELAIYARGMGVPVIFNRLLGSIEQDPTQTFAYQCASMITCFFPEEIEMGHYAYKDKTHYYGYISKYNSIPDSSTNNSTITILMGSDGPSIETLQHITANQNYVFHIIGNREPLPLDPKVIQYGRVTDISQYIEGSVVISSAGLNSISELLALQKKIILLPEDRPYDEQVINATQLALLGRCVVATHDADTAQWNTYIHQALQLDEPPSQFLYQQPARNFSKDMETYCEAI